MVLVMSVLHLIREIPECIKKTEGMSLVDILPQTMLINLNRDKKFLSTLFYVNDEDIKKYIIRKLL